MANTNSSSPVDRLIKGGAQTANREAKGRYLGELAHRERASDILSPGEVSGEYNSARLLSTTLGGQLRALTHDDLQTFRNNVKKLGKKFKGGITAKGVIDLSTQVDRDRSNQEIRTAIPMQSIAGRMHFITNAGPNSDVTRHHIHIEMLNYNAAISSPGKLPDLAKMLTSGPLKFDCDCGRHTFWFRHIATVGNFNAGRPETGFPKIRNPGLVGVACKHVLRVMVQLAMPITRMQVEKMIDRGRNSMDNKVQRLTKKEAEEIAKKQADQAHWKRSQVETAGQKKDRLIRSKSAQITVLLAKTKISKKQKQVAINAFKTMMHVNVAQGVFTAKEAEAMLSVLK